MRIALARSTQPAQRKLTRMLDLYTVGAIVSPILVGTVGSTSLIMWRLKALERSNRETVATVNKQTGRIIKLETKVEAMT